MSKYNNRKTVRGPLAFDSQKEAGRYDELMLLLRAGDIRDVKLQPEFTLQEAFTTLAGERVKAIRYKADFSYWRLTLPDCNGDRHWVRVVEDVKGCRTKEYLIKRKMMQDMGVTVVEV